MRCMAAASLYRIQLFRDAAQRPIPSFLTVGIV